MPTRPDDDMPRHGAYVLRLWEARSTPPDATRWRLSLEDVHTGKKHKFRDLEELRAFLEEWMGSDTGGDAHREAEHEPLPAERYPGAVRSRASILLVEDDEVLRQRLRRWIEVSLPGSPVTTADSADAAAILARSGPDLILIDAAAPVGRGLETVRRLRSAAPGARIVVLGTEDTEAYGDQISAAGADAYVPMWRIREELTSALQDRSSARPEQVEDEQVGDEPITEKTVVCIEDEPDMIALIKLALERHSVRLIGALGGQEGLDLVRRVKPDLVLLDLMMPDVNGAEVLKQMRADESLTGIPIIVITVLDPYYSAKQGVDLERIDGFIRKPFVPQELVETVNATLQPVA